MKFIVLAGALVGTSAISLPARADVTGRAGVSLSAIDTGFSSYALGVHGAVAYEPGDLFRFSATESVQITPWRIGTPAFTTMSQTTGLVGVRIGTITPELGGGVDFISAPFCRPRTECHLARAVAPNAHLRIGVALDKDRKGFTFQGDLHAAIVDGFGVVSSLSMGGAWAF